MQSVYHDADYARLPRGLRAHRRRQLRH
jgi:hypothetical protein